MLSSTTCSSPTDISFSDSIYLELMAENIFTNQNNFSNQTKENNDNTISNQLKALITNTKEISSLIVSINTSLKDRDIILDNIYSLLESLKSDVNLLFKNDLFTSLHKKQVKDTTLTYEEIINTTISKLNSLLDYHIHFAHDLDPDSNSSSTEAYIIDMSNTIQIIQQNLYILYNNINTIKEITNQKSLQQQFYSYTTNTNNNNKPGARNPNFRPALNPKSTTLKLSMSNELNDIRQLKDKDKQINDSNSMSINLQTYALKRYVYHTSPMYLTHILIIY